MEINVSTKGQIVLPAKLRKKYHIDGGTKLRVIDDGEKIILIPVTRDYIEAMRGVLKGSGAFKILNQERQAERDL
jgi:AbrB family looped-hinge helix DNA binding protein